MYENNLCPRCGQGTYRNVFFGGERYCTECGNILVIKMDFGDYNKFCQKCNRGPDLYSQNKYCPYCGEKLKTKGQRRWFF